MTESRTNQRGEYQSNADGFDRRRVHERKSRRARNEHRFSLEQDGVAIRAGHHCCQIFHEKMNLTATARASIGVYNTKDDIDILCKAIENCRKVFDLK